VVIVVKTRFISEIEELVEEILLIKQRAESKEQKDTANLESQIDEMVFGLYELEEGEVRVILD
jgi:hypothetical protein